MSDDDTATQPEAPAETPPADGGEGTPEAEGSPSSEGDSPVGPDPNVDLLVALDERGFSSKEDALILIKRHDDALRTANYENGKLDERKKELDTKEQALVTAERELDKKAAAYLKVKEANADLLAQIKKVKGQ